MSTCQRLGTTRVVAVKVIAPRGAAEPQFLARWQRGAETCGRRRHPKIVDVTDFRNRERRSRRHAGNDRQRFVLTSTRFVLSSSTRTITRYRPSGETANPGSGGKTFCGKLVTTVVRRVRNE